MGEVADMMLTGVLCAMCGVYLDCEECEAMEIPMYCSKQCAKNAGEDPEHRVCHHDED